MFSLFLQTSLLFLIYLLYPIYPIYLIYLLHLLHFFTQFHDSHSFELAVQFLDVVAYEGDASLVAQGEGAEVVEFHLFIILDGSLQLFHPAVDFGGCFRDAALLLAAYEVDELGAVGLVIGNCKSDHILWRQHGVAVKTCRLVGLGEGAEVVDENGVIL